MCRVICVLQFKWILPRSKYIIRLSPVIHYTFVGIFVLNGGSVNNPPLHTGSWSLVKRETFHFPHLHNQQDKRINALRAVISTPLTRTHTSRHCSSIICNIIINPFRSSLRQPIWSNLKSTIHLHQLSTDCYFINMITIKMGTNNK